MSILGQVSYSIYLVHLIVIAAVMRVVPHPLAVWSDFQANVLLTGVLVVLPVVALALHLVIERPFFSFKRVYVLPGKPQLHEIVPQCGCAASTRISENPVLPPQGPRGAFAR